jgi:pimeloyl-ACP methyl ester carboxylesterase
MKQYVEELIFTESDDGLALEGVVMRPASQPPQPIAVVWIHGNTGKFYDWPYVAIGRALASAGYLFISGNTRGHDIGTMLWRIKDDMPFGAGSAWELIEESPYDVAAWVRLGSAQGAQGVALVGHSQGAAKVAYYQAQRQDPLVRGVALASPDLHGHWPSEMVAQAQQLVAEGRGDELLPPAAGDEPWYRLSAHNVLSRARILSHMYHSDQGQPYVAAVRCPLLAFFGTSNDIGGTAELETLRENALSAARVNIELIEGADHVYTACEPQTAALIAQWVMGLDSQKSQEAV